MKPVVTPAVHQDIDFHLRRGDKLCPKCRLYKKPIEFGNDRKRKDGKACYCLACVRAQSNAYYKSKTDVVDNGAAHVPVELFPPAAPGEGIGCLRCRHAQTTLNTSFERAKPGAVIPIFCHKQEKTVRLQWEKCPVADPRLAQPRHLAKYWKKYGPLGDLARGATPLTLAFLRATWTWWPVEALEAATGWTMFKLSQIVRYHKVGGVEVGRSRLHLSNPVKGRTCFTRDQSDWLLQEYRSERWPKPNVYCLSSGKKGAITRKRNQLLDKVATMGPRWTWEQIQRHIHKRQKTEFQRARRRGSRKVNQHLTIGPDGVAR